LAKLDWLVAERRKIAARYQEAFGDIPFLRLPSEPEDCITNWQSYSIYLKPECPVSRNELMQNLLDKGISTRRGVMTTHRETAYSIKAPGLRLPVSEDLADRSIIIPLYIPMELSEIETVIAEFRKALGV